MDIRCPSCKTLYEFNENRIKHGSVKLKCSQCGHVFRVEGRPKAETKAKKTGRWMVRRSDQEILYFQGLTTLQKWIIDRKVGPDDEISRSGKSWKRLGSITELASFFEVAQSIASLQRERPEASPVSPVSEPIPELTPDPDLFDPMAPDSQDEVVAAAPRGRLDMDISSEMAPPKPLEPTTGSMGTFDDSFDDYELQSGSSKWIRIAATLLFVGVIIAGGWVYLQHPEWLGIVPTPDSEVQTPAVDAGDVSSEVAVVQADTASGGDASDASPDVVEAKGDTGNARNRNAKVEGRKRSEKVRGLADKKKADPGAAGFEGSIQRGNRALKSGKKQRALEAFSAAVRENPGSAEAHRGLGWSYVSLGLSSGAVRSFKAAIRLNPRYGDAYIGLGKAYRMAGNKAAAVKAYERYLAMYPSGPSAYTARYQVETLKGKSKAPSKAPSPSDKSAVPSGGGSNSAPPGATVGPLPDKVKKK